MGLWMGMNDYRVEIRVYHAFVSDDLKIKIEQSARADSPIKALGEVLRQCKEVPEALAEAYQSGSPHRREG